MSTINKNSLVHLVATAINGNRCYITQLGTKRNSRGELVLDAQFDDDASRSQPMPYEHALIVKRRLRDEHNVFIRFAQVAGDLADFVDEPGQEADNSATSRITQHYRGLIIRPFNPKGWCCKLRDDNGERESVRGETPEEVGDKVIERGLFEIAEKAPTPPPPDPLKTQQAPSYRKRPGSI